MIKNREVSMEKKDICVNCKNESNCVLSRKFPVWDCNEYIIDSSKSKIKKTKGIATK